MQSPGEYSDRRAHITGVWLLLAQTATRGDLAKGNEYKIDTDTDRR